MLCPDRPKATATATKSLQSQAVARVTFHSARVAQLSSFPFSSALMCADGAFDVWRPFNLLLFLFILIFVFLVFFCVFTVFVVLL